MNIYTIPDIHGRYDLLTRLMDDLAPNLTEDKLIVLGDMVDRGPQSYEVLTYLRELQDAFPESVVLLAGNHEWLLIDACARKSMHDFGNWYGNGGRITEDSFPGGFVDDDTVRWLASLPIQHKEPGFFFSHAPVPRENIRSILRRGQPFAKDELIWTYHTAEDEAARDFKREDNADQIGVCGHVHQLMVGVKEPRFYDHYIFADAGCGCSEEAPLVAIEVNSRDVTYAWPRGARSPVEKKSRF